MDTPNLALRQLLTLLGACQRPLLRLEDRELGIDQQELLPKDPLLLLLHEDLGFGMFTERLKGENTRSREIEKMDLHLKWQGLAWK